MKKFWIVTEKGKFLVEGEAGNWKIDIEGRKRVISGTYDLDRDESVYSEKLLGPEYFKKHCRVGFLADSVHFGFTAPIKSVLHEVN